MTISGFMNRLTGSPSRAFLMRSCWYDICEAFRRNRPMRAHHRPVMKLPEMNVTMPMRIMANPKPVPILDATRVAH